jgi:2-polyprenyl-3-methyl-5-hydroxy-6-metoxy-1,4-benzoquinol methylase
MKRVYPSQDWPDSWNYSYGYDLEEIYGPTQQLGYAYAYNNRRSITLGLITEVLPRGATILDLAAAQGNFSLTLAEMGYQVTWNDLRSDLEGYVRLKHECGKICYAPGNAFELTFSDLFDAVLITEIIEHVAHPDQFLNKVAQLIKPGGYVVMTTPNGKYFRNNLPKFSDCEDPSVFESVQFKPNCDGHIFLIHPDELAPLATKAGLTVDHSVFFTNPLTHGHMKTGALLKIMPKSLVDYVESWSSGLPKRIQERILLGMGARLQKSL